MLSINCVLANLANQLRIAEEYGLCKPELVEKVKNATAYNWINSYAAQCLTDCQLQDIDIFVNSNFNCISDNPCEDTVVNCAAITVEDVTNYGTLYTSTITITDDYN